MVVSVWTVVEGHVRVKVIVPLAQPARKAYRRLVTVGGSSTSSLWHAARTRKPTPATTRKRLRDFMVKNA
jgi:hypothetical protein